MFLCNIAILFDISYSSFNDRNIRAYIHKYVCIYLSIIRSGISSQLFRPKYIIVIIIIILYREKTGTVDERLIHFPADANDTILCCTRQIRKIKIIIISHLLIALYTLRTVFIKFLIKKKKLHFYKFIFIRFIQYSVLRFGENTDRSQSLNLYTSSFICVIHEIWHLGDA
jgi:hypothetical protein